MSPLTEPALILWDIDHTLLTTGGVSHEVYARAFRTVVGTPMAALADMAGRTERAIVLDTLALNHVADPEDKLDAFYAALGEVARDMKDQMRAHGRRLPGAAEAIAGLANADLIQSVVTGNLPAIAAVKLEAFDLLDGLDTSVGGYGDDGSDRADLVRLALQRAATAYGRPFAAKRTVIVGDTPHDIRGAHDAGAVAIGVATGRSSVEDLAAVGAEVVFADLSDTAAVRTAVFQSLLGGI
ncbi:MAG TPA: haloacid dehalogenase-like hydrolase [Actinocrinis sp.]|nr:haloacid dehalogenase-like hydrolase [Actinocrinis sp.]